MVVTLLSRPRFNLRSFKYLKRRMFSQKMPVLGRWTQGSSRLHPSQLFNHNIKLVLLPSQRDCLPFLLQMRHLHQWFTTNLHHNSKVIYSILKCNQSHLLHLWRPYHRNPTIPHPHRQQRLHTSNIRHHQPRSHKHLQQHNNIISTRLSMLHILNLLRLEVLTARLQPHPCPISQKKQHLMGQLTGRSPSLHSKPAASATTTVTAAWPQFRFKPPPPPATAVAAATSRRATFRSASF